MVTDLTEKIKIVWHDLKDNHDSTIGINWEVIDFYIEDYEWEEHLKKQKDLING